MTGCDSLSTHDQLTPVRSSLSAVRRSYGGLCPGAVRCWVKGVFAREPADALYRHCVQTGLSVAHGPMSVSTLPCEDHSLHAICT